MRKPIWLAVIMVAVLCLWMVSGLFSHPASQENETELKVFPFRVEVQTSRATKVRPHLRSHGQTLPSQEVTLKSQTQGKVDVIFKKQGDKVQRGEALVRIEQDDRMHQLEMAQAKVEETKSHLNALKRLDNRGYIAKTKLLEANTAYKGALAQLQAIKLDIQHTTLQAPFNGRINQKHVELGDALMKGDPVVTIVNNDPLLIETYIPQQKIKQIVVGQQAKIRLITGETMMGTVSFIAPKANQSTRTFRVEVEVKNENAYPSGMSAELQFPTKPISGHYISPSIFVLGLNGETGVMSVDEKHIVKFNPVTILYSAEDGVWVEGLPQAVNLVVLGQGFINQGEQVLVVNEPNRAQQSIEVAKQKDMKQEA